VKRRPDVRRASLPPFVPRRRCDRKNKYYRIIMFRMLHCAHADVVDSHYGRFIFLLHRTSGTARVRSQLHHAGQRSPELPLSEGGVSVL
jgi:hypothetical protein